MKRLLFAALVLASPLTASRAVAQLAPYNEAGLTMGHWHIAIEPPSPEGEGFCAPQSAEADVKRGAPRPEAEAPAFNWRAIGGQTRAPR